MIFLLTLLAGCSASKPAPISDRNTDVKNTNEKPNRTNLGNPNATTAKVNPVPTPRPIVQKNNPKEIVKTEPKLDSQKAPSILENGFKLLKPTNAPIATNFNEVTNKGIEFAGKLGDPIFAAADGKVIYSGSNLRTYGNLIILNHSNSFVTVYANNKTLLVKEGDAVKRGQKIAEMGNSESDKVKLHFELRKNSKPIDPSTYFTEN
jgi:lipoprotein NlpD